MKIPSRLLLFLLCLPMVMLAQTPALDGSWVLIPELSTDIDLYGTLYVTIRTDGPRVTLVQKWGATRSTIDSLVLTPGGSPVSLPVTSRVFPSNVFMGLMRTKSSTREFSASWEKPRQTLLVREKSSIRGSQGPTDLTTTHRFALDPAEDLLTYSVDRSTRTSGPAQKYVLKRVGTRQGYVLQLEDNWEISGKLPVQAMLISLQGIVNKSGPHVYILYPDNWPFTYVRSVYDFYRTKKGYTFRELHGAAEALTALRDHVKGYVVWDTSVRTSLIVAFTLAGLEQAVVVSEDLIPLAQKAGLKQIDDYRGRFRGKSDTEIYQWAYDQYWARCNKDFIIWMGGEPGPVMKPGVADWGICKGAFFNDLSSRPTDSSEYALANRLLREMHPMSMVMGWHSYGKDLEREHVKLTSSYGHRVEGLHTLPNLSFSAQVPATAGFTFRNNHSVVPGKTYVPEQKVYVTCIQTDGIGLGAWLKPGRGEIPYAWEVLMNYTWMAPSMAEYFYTLATPNDYFLGCLSGPGYMYPKAVPKNMLPAIIAKAREQMKTLDLRVFELMDYSEGATVEGNSDLPADVVDAYYKGMPEAIGFVNGYAPSYTFTSRDGKPFMSYDYYLSPVRPEADAVADLQELARVNAQRPYFLLIHVRESSDVKRVKGILDKLGPGFEVVPLDKFLTMAGQQPTFRERFKE